jgi:hypothetical protein
VLRALAIVMVRSDRDVAETLRRVRENEAANG